MAKVRFPTWRRTSAIVRLVERNWTACSPFGAGFAEAAPAADESTTIPPTISVGTITCSVTDTVGPISGSFEITWYGAFRRAVFTIEFNGTEPPPPCSDDVLHLYRAIQTFAASTGALGLGPTLQ